MIEDQARTLGGAGSRVFDWPAASVTDFERHLDTASWLVCWLDRRERPAQERVLEFAFRT